MAEKPFIFICGNDDFLVGKAGKEKWNELTKDVTDDLSIEVIDASVNTISEVEHALQLFASGIQTLSMFGDRKYVWLKNISFLADNVLGRSEGTKKQCEDLLDLLESIDPTGVSILLTASPVDRRKKNYKSLFSLGNSEFLEEKKDASAALKVINDECKKLGLKLDYGVAEYLSAKINGNARLAYEEVNKLADYIGDSGLNINTQLINELVPNFGEGDFFEAVEMFYSLKLEPTLSAIHRHFFSGQDIRPLLAALQNRNRLLVQLRSLIDAGQIKGRLNQQSLSTLSSRFSNIFGDKPDKNSFCVLTQNPWYLGRLIETAEKLNLKRLIDIQQGLIDVFEQMIQRPSDHEEIMKEFAISHLR